MKSCHRSLDPDQVLIWEDLVKIPLTFSKSPCMILHRSLWEDLVEILVKSFLRGASRILHRSLSGDLVEILVRSSLRSACVKILQMRCLRGALMKAFLRCSCGVLVSAALRAPLHQQVLLWRSCEILLGPGMKILVKVFYNSLWEDLRSLSEDLEEVLVKSLHDLVQVLVRRSCGDPVEILLKRSLH